MGRAHPLLNRGSCQLTSTFLCTRTKLFHTALGTTGSVATGAYTLADGQHGNLYTGPYPKPGGADTVTVEASSATATDSSDDAATTAPPESPKTVTVQAGSTDDSTDTPTSVSPKTVTVEPNSVGGQATNSANTVLGASQTSAKVDPSSTGGAKASEAWNNNVAIGVRTGIALVVALITIFAI